MSFENHVEEKTLILLGLLMCALMAHVKESKSEFLHW
jgi:hypothetical protein